jgi:hypothetical protein
MLQEGMPVDPVAKCTGYTIEVLEKVKAQNS